MAENVAIFSQREKILFQSICLCSHDYKMAILKCMTVSM